MILRVRLKTVVEMGLNSCRVFAVIDKASRQVWPVVAVKNVGDDAPVAKIQSKCSDSVFGVVISSCVYFIYS